MAKVIEPAYKFKPIKCSVCGCIYEYEQGDHIKVFSAHGLHEIIVFRKLNCPVCRNENTLEVEGE